MATTRIKYKKLKDGTEQSKNFYSVKYKTYYYVVKDETSEFFWFKVVNVNQKRVIYESKKDVTNRAVLSRNIRSKLIALGVEMEKESRPHQVAPSTEARKRGGYKSVRKKADVTDE